MQLQFSLEDDNDVDIKIDEDSVNIEINAAKTDVEDAEDKLELITSAIDNLVTVKNHILKFGITPQFLHLVNTNNSLGSAIGLALPYYEDDNADLDQVDKDELPDTEVVLESMEETLGKAKEKFLAALKWLKDKALALWNKIKQWLGIKSKKIEEAIAKTETSTVEKMIKENMQAYAEEKSIDKNSSVDSSSTVTNDEVNDSSSSVESKIRTRPTITAAELIDKIEDLEENESFNIYKYYVVDADTKATTLIQAWERYTFTTGKIMPDLLTKDYFKKLPDKIIKLNKAVLNAKIDDQNNIIFDIEPYNAFDLSISGRTGYLSYNDEGRLIHKSVETTNIIKKYDGITIEEAGWHSIEEWKKDLMHLNQIITNILASKHIEKKGEELFNILEKNSGKIFKENRALSNQIFDNARVVDIIMSSVVRNLTDLFGHGVERPLNFYRYRIESTFWPKYKKK